MTDYVEITLRRNRGWPWPEKSWGLTPMYGEDGWCRTCGVPKHEQTGSIVPQRKGLASASGGWVPHWQFDVYCLDANLALTAAEQFGVTLRPVQWSKNAPGGASQIVISSTSEPWFDPELLAVQGQPCVDCGNIAGRQVADHIDPLVKEYYRTGSIDLQRMRSIDAVQPQCPTCSARQGGELSHYSVQMRKQLGLE